MIVTEADLRDQLRRPTPGAQVTIPAGARLSPSAADFIKQWGLIAVDVESSLSSDLFDETAQHLESTNDWDRAAVFPIAKEVDSPRCISCGTKVRHKLDAMTQLNACHYALKTHPRIVLRGRIDSLHALVLLCQRIALEQGETELTKELGTLAAYCRELISAEYNERPVAELTLTSWDTEQIHAVTHDPKGTLGINHLTIGENEPQLQHWLNLARTMSREIEITALETFPSPHHPYGASICHAFNRLSSVFYFLQLRLKAGIH